MGFDADAVEREDGADAEPDAEDEADGPPVMLCELVLPKIIKRRRPLSLVPGSAG